MHIKFDDSVVGDLKLVTICGCWWQYSDDGDIFWVLVPDAYVKRCWMLVTKMTKPRLTSFSCHQHISFSTSVTNIDPLNFISDQHWTIHVKFYFCKGLKCNFNFSGAIMPPSDGTISILSWRFVISNLVISSAVNFKRTFLDIVMPGQFRKPTFDNFHRFLQNIIFDYRKFPEKLQTFGSNWNFPLCRNRSGLKTFGSGKVLGSLRIAARKPLTKVPFGMKYP